MRHPCTEQLAATPPPPPWAGALVTPAGSMPTLRRAAVKLTAPYRSLLIRRRAMSWIAFCMAGSHNSTPQGRLPRRRWWRLPPAASGATPCLPSSYCRHHSASTRFTPACSPHAGAAKTASHLRSGAPEKNMPALASPPANRINHTAKTQQNKTQWTRCGCGQEVVGSRRQAASACTRRATSRQGSRQAAMAAPAAAGGGGKCSGAVCQQEEQAAWHSRRAIGAPAP